MAKMTPQEYARHRACSAVAVYKQLKAGTLTGAYVQDGKKTIIDSELADNLWPVNSRSVDMARLEAEEHRRKLAEEVPGNPPRKRGRPRKDAPKAPPKPKKAPPKPGKAPETADLAELHPTGDTFDTIEPDGQTGGALVDPGLPSITASRQRLEHWKAMEAEAKYLAAASELVSAAKVRTWLFNRVRGARDSLMALPDRLSEILAAETDPRRVYALLAEELQAVCSELAEPPDATFSAARTSPDPAESPE